ncbi:hypothetical protein JTB14_006299 [Gonioctena quinquepunctata]|nr:hypothetical protein JTB14_006299 [Gonioctena quinquepunctata]
MSFQLDKSKLYQELFESFKKSHTNTKVQNVQKLVNEVWRNYKLQAKSDKELDIIVFKRIEELQAATKNKSNLLHFFSKATTTCKTTEKTQIIQPASNIKKQEEDKIKPGVKSQQQCENNEDADKQRAKPFQEAMKNKIALLEKNLNALYSARDTMPSRAEVDKQIIKLRKELKTAEQSLQEDSKRSCPEETQGCRGGTYIRLIPRKSNSAEGRRHVSTVPVKLIRAQNDHHKSHLGSNFAETSIHYLENIASILGPDQVFFISQDDKARVPIGVTAANKQAPLLMHMEYRIKLPDHDWVIAERHKLIPSVYAGIKITSSMLGQPQAVGYSGPTYIAIRSGKHSSSTANTHAQDFETLLELEEFRPLAKTDHGLVKPVVIMTVDGGPDENPRYQKVIVFAIQHFKRHDLDALFVATNAPGRSAYNRVERRMAPLSRELAGLILAHDHFGSYLGDRGVTINEHLERSNFEFAGNVLAEVWSSMEIDGYHVTAKYIGAGEQDLLDFPDIKWYSEHVRESQYLLQIVKCRNTECWRPRSGRFRLLDNSFLPPPVKVKQTVDDLVLDEGGEFLNLPVNLALRLSASLKDFLQRPYDYFCPTVKLRLSSRTCKTCGLYHASVKSLNRHIEKIHKKVNTHTDRKVRPVRVAARRADELMCIIQNLEHHDVEWLDENDVDIPKLDERSEEVKLVFENEVDVLQPSIDGSVSYEDGENEDNAQENPIGENKYDLRDRCQIQPPKYLSAMIADVDIPTSYEQAITSEQSDRNIDGDIIYLALFVDDGLILTKSNDTVQKLLAHLEMNFEITRGDAKCFIGIELWRDRRNKQIGITQQCFVKKILKKFNMSDCSPSNIPFQPGLQLQNDSNVNEEPPNIPYREAVGSLLYLAMISRPDLAFDVSYVSQFLNNYSSQHWTAVKKILRYLQGTKSFGIIYGRCEEFNGIDLCGYTDADYAGDVTTRKSRTGYVFMINGSPVTWCSQRQQVVALSTTEAEYIALSFGAEKLFGYVNY